MRITPEPPYKQLVPNPCWVMDKLPKGAAAD